MGRGRCGRRCGRAAAFSRECLGLSVDRVLAMLNEYTETIAAALKATRNITIDILRRRQGPCARRPLCEATGSAEMSRVCKARNCMQPGLAARAYLDTLPSPMRETGASIRCTPFAPASSTRSCSSLRRAQRARTALAKALPQTQATKSPDLQYPFISHTLPQTKSERSAHSCAHPRQIPLGLGAPMHSHPDSCKHRGTPGCTQGTSCKATHSRTDRNPSAQAPHSRRYQCHCRPPRFANKYIKAARGRHDTDARILRNQITCRPILCDARRFQIEEWS